MNTADFQAFDYLNTEIIILNAESFEIVGINDAAKAANWIGESPRFDGQKISSLLEEETGQQFNKILIKNDVLAPSLYQENYNKNFIEIPSRAKIVLYS